MKGKTCRCPRATHAFMGSTEMAHYEAVRLQALHDYAVLDTPPEPNFDRITRLAAAIFGLPICTMSLADAERHWFKSHYGVDATEIPRCMSFCDETLLRPAGFVVPDALADERFVQAHVVTNPPRIRFYAGTPLITPAGHRIGSLCVLDTHPHHDFSDAQMAILANLAGTSIELLEARSRNIQLARCTAELAHIAGHDPLTGLPNRRMLQAKFESAVATAAKEDELALLYIDLDQFKRVNDTLGHGVGDELLQKIGDRLRQSVRWSDEVSRLGGDEFVVLVSGQRIREHATELAERLLIDLNAPYRLQGRTVFITASIGITFVRNVLQNRPRLEDVLRNADIGLYEAKTAGKNQFRCFEPHDGSKAAILAREDC